MTEDEAKKKLCCGPLYSGDILLGKERAVLGLPLSPKANGLCIGANCMAWRLEPREELETVYDSTEKPEGEDWKPYSASPNNCAWTRPSKAPVIGYCGLAGKP